MIGHFIENLGQLPRVSLANTKDDRLAYFAANRVTQRLLKKGLAKELIGRFGKEAFLEFGLLEFLLLILAGVVGERDHEALIGKEFSGDLSARVHHRRVDKVAVLHTLQQGVAEGWLTFLAAESAVGVKQ